MRLEPTEVPALPLPAALFDAGGVTIAATPEWAGRCPGTLSYQAGACHLLVAPDAPTPGLDALMGRLLDELRSAAAALTGGQFSLGCEFGEVSRDAVVKPSTNGDDQVGLLHSHVGIGRTVHAEHVE